MIAGISGSSYAVGAGMVVNGGTTRVRVIKSGSTTVWYGSQDMAAATVPTTIPDYSDCASGVRTSIATLSNSSLRETLNNYVVQMTENASQYPQQDIPDTASALNTTWTNTIMARAVINTSANLTSYRTELTNFETSVNSYESMVAQRGDVALQYYESMGQVMGMVGEYGGSTTSGNTALTTFGNNRSTSQTQAAAWISTTRTNISKNKVTLGM